MNNIDFYLAEDFLTEFLYNNTEFNEFESILQIDKVEKTLKESMKQTIFNY